MDLPDRVHPLVGVSGNQMRMRMFELNAALCRHLGIQEDNLQPFAPLRYGGGVGNAERPEHPAGGKATSGILRKVCGKTFDSAYVAYAMPDNDVSVDYVVEQFK